MISFAKHCIKWLIRPDYRKQARIEADLRRLKVVPRPKDVQRVQVGDDSFYITDPASFVFMYQEIFGKEIYAFPLESSKGLILDAGANIGLSVIYFKKKYPEARLVAFEPDKEICAVLKKNCELYNLKGVEVVPKALWSHETTLNFQADGSDSGRVDEKGSIQVPTARLSVYLQEPVDFLKIDIEGAELVVLEECAPFLGNVKRLFVEYHSFLNKEQGLADILTILRNGGFRVHITNPAFASEQAFVRRREGYGMDMQLNIYCFRD